MDFLFQIILIIAGYEYISWRIKSKKSIKDWWNGCDKERIYEGGAILLGLFSFVLILFTAATHLSLIYLDEVSISCDVLWMPITSYPAIAICLFCVIKKNEFSKK